MPLRSSARILRLWFKPWEDADRDLYDQGYVYVQIDAGQWLIDHAQRQIRDAYAPIRPPMGTTVKPATPEQSTSPVRPVGQQRPSPYAPDNSESPDIGPLLPPSLPRGSFSAATWNDVSTMPSGPRKRPIPCSPMPSRWKKMPRWWPIPRR